MSDVDLIDQQRQNVVVYVCRQCDLPASAHSARDPDFATAKEALEHVGEHRTRGEVHMSRLTMKELEKRVREEYGAGAP
jgi:hypothetical protein